MKFLFVLRYTFRWWALAMLVGIPIHLAFRWLPGWIIGLGIVGTTFVALVAAFSHVRRVQLIADKLDTEALGNRHRRHIEIPLPADVAFDLVEAAIRELPHVENVESARDSLQVRARVLRMDPYMRAEQGKRRGRTRRNLVLATVTPMERTGSLTLICEPEGGALVDWFVLDHGTNLENAGAITRAVTRRIAERRRGEEAMVRETASDKALAEAKLSLLHAQVEPHFLYNTLASAQLLTRSDPARADVMLGHLITYLRHSVPRAEAAALSTLGEELERARAYLEILRIRMGERLRVDLQVPEALKSAPVPPMVLQTLVENAIKHGLEPVPGGGTVWILARETEGRVAITVADDGRGFSDEAAGTGIGLANVRERLKLAFGDAASFNIAANFPRGVAATLTVPAKVAAHA